MTTGTATSFAGAWQRFLTATDVVVGEGVEGEWAQGRAQFLTFLVPVAGGGTRAAVGAYVESLRDLPSLDIYPPDYWHITLKLVGFQVVRKTRPDDVLRQDVGPILYAAERALAGQDPFEVEVGPIGSFADAVILEVHDGGRLKEMHRRLASALAAYPRFQFEGDAYLPHISLARYRGVEGLDEVKQRLAARRAAHPAGGATAGSNATLPVRRVELVKVWLTDDYPEFELVQGIALGGHR